jgi:Mn-dependent DtxR family transcriptional regulator
MVQKMAKAGLLNHERYRGLTLTPTGEAAALGIRHRHQVLSAFLTHLGCPRTWWHAMSKVSNII